jgi:hypothetical protein
MTIATDFKTLLPHEAAIETDDRPPYYLWCFDPTDGHVIVTHNRDRHPAEAHTHATMAPEIVHPERLRGYAYPIKDGWRITNDDHKKLTDPFVIKRVLAALRKEHPPAPLPSIRYHGDPRKG